MSTTSCSDLSLRGEEDLFIEVEMRDRVYVVSAAYARVRKTNGGDYKLVVHGSKPYIQVPFTHIPHKVWAELQCVQLELIHAYPMQPMNRDTWRFTHHAHSMQGILLELRSDVVRASIAHRHQPEARGARDGALEDFQRLHEWRRRSREMQDDHARTTLFCGRQVWQDNATVPVGPCHGAKYGAHLYL